MEPFTLAALGGVALTEGIKFLYNQAGEILKRRRDRKQGADAGAEATPVETPAILEGTLNPITVDLNAADELAEHLKALRAELNEYAQGIDEADPQDETVLEATSALRDAVESIIGQRITFTGEDREPSGTPVVTGTLRVKNLRGRGTGAEVEEVLSGEVTGTAEADTVEKGADLAGLRAKSVGNARNRKERP
jgi:hypothetical protein